MESTTPNSNTPMSTGRTWAEIRGFSPATGNQTPSLPLVPEHLRQQMILAGPTPFMAPVEIDEPFDDELRINDTLSSLSLKLLKVQLSDITKSKNTEEILEAMIKYGTDSTLRVANQEIANIRAKLVSSDAVVTAFSKIFKIGLVQPINGSMMKVEVADLGGYLRTVNELHLFISAINSSKDEEIVSNVINYLKANKRG